jgi:hypothetical protein
MLNKFFKFTAKFAVLGVFTFSAINAANADGCYTPKPKKPCMTAPKAVEECFTPKYDECSKPMLPEVKGLTPGMTIGIGGDWLFGIDENKDFVTSLTDGTNTYTYLLNSKLDSGYGGSLSFGYMMDSNFLGELEVAYKDIKYKDSTNSGNSLETTNWLGLLRGTYFIDAGSMVYPYLSAAVGFSRVKIDNATIVGNNADADVIKFSDIKKTKIAGDLGIGIAAAMQSALLSVGLKVAANQDIKSSDLSATYTDGSAFPDDKYTASFGKLRQINYGVEAKLRMLLG